MGVLVGGTAYILLFWQGLQIKNINITGANIVSTQELESLVLEKSVSLGTKNILLANTSKIAGDILQNYPPIKSVEVKKVYPDSISVSVTERKQEAVACQDQNCFSVDGDGVAFMLAQNNDGVLQITGGNQPVPGKKIVEKPVMDTVIALRSDLQNNFQISLGRVQIGNPLTAITHEGWRVQIDPTGDTKIQLAKMDSLLKGEITADQRKKMQYLYLQYQDRAYYK